MRLYTNKRAACCFVSEACPIPSPLALLRARPARDADPAPASARAAGGGLSADLKNPDPAKILPWRGISWAFQLPARQRPSERVKGADRGGRGRRRMSNREDKDRVIEELQRDKEVLRVIIEDVLSDRGFAPYRDIARAADFRSVQSTPLVSSNGALVGILSRHFSSTHCPPREQRQALKILSRLSADAIIEIPSTGTNATTATTGH